MAEAKPDGCGGGGDYQTDHSAVAICVHALSYSEADQMSPLHKWHHLHIFSRTVTQMTRRNTRDSHCC